MRSIVTVLLLVIQIWVTGCMKYQFATVSSDMAQNPMNEHVLENDTLVIKYTFHGADCPVKVLIHNKLDVPLYVDWKRSALILNGQSYGYWNDKASLRATSTGSQIQWTSAVSAAQSTITGEITRDESVGFIPPRSFKQTDLTTVQGAFVKLTGDRKDHRDVVVIADMPVSGLQYEYFREESPLTYRSYLTVSSDPSFRNSSAYENEFWVSEIFETMVPPKTYFKDPNNRNKFYRSKTTGIGTFMGVTGIVALLALLALKP